MTTEQQEYTGRRVSNPALDSEPTYDDYARVRENHIKTAVKAYEAQLRAHYEVNPHVQSIFTKNMESLLVAATALASEADALRDQVFGEWL